MYGTWRRPTHRRTAAEKSPPSSGSRRPRPPACAGSTAKRRFVVEAGGADQHARVQAGRPGPRASLNRPKSATSSAPYILGSSSARAWPSPCSPDSEPPCATTRSATSSEKRAEAADARAGSAGRSRSGRGCSRRRSGRTACRAGRARPAAPGSPAGTRPVGPAAPRSPPSPARPPPPSGIRVAVPLASSRMRHSARWPAGSVRRASRRARRPPARSPSARARASAGPFAARLHEQPGAARGAAPCAVRGPGPRPCPRRSAGRAAAGPAAASAAALSSAYAEHGERPRARGARPGVRPPPSRTPSVPSLPQNARASVRRPSRAAARPARSRRSGGAAVREAGAQQRQIALRPARAGRAGAPRPVPAQARAGRRRTVITVSSRTLSAVVPQATECAPHELLPIMPPSVQRLWVDGSGPKAQAVRGDGVLEACPGRRPAGRPPCAPRGPRRARRVHVPGEVQHDARAGGLPGDRRAPAARHDRHAVRPADRQRRGHVVGVPRGDDADRDPPVVGRVHGGQRPGRGVETDLAPDGPAQFRLQRPKIRHDSSMHPTTDSDRPDGQGNVHSLWEPNRNTANSITNSPIVTAG